MSEEKIMITRENGLLSINGVLCTYETKEIRATIQNLSEIDSVFELPERYTYILTPSESHGQVAKISDKAVDQPQQSPVKTLAECKDEVAMSKGFRDWQHLKEQIPIGAHESFYNEVAHLFRSQPAPVTEGREFDKAKTEIINLINGYKNAFDQMDGKKSNYAEGYYDALVNVHRDIFRILNLQSTPTDHDGE